MRKSVTISFDVEMIRQLENRAKANYVSVRELLEDIIRRSMISYGKRSGPADYSEKDIEKIVKVFSRKQRSRKAKK